MFNSRVFKTIATRGYSGGGLSVYGSQFQGHCVYYLEAKCILYVL